MALRQVGSMVLRDERKFYRFRLPSGREVETKSDSLEQARDMISNCLKIDKEELINDFLYSKAA